MGAGKYTLHVGLHVRQWRQLEGIKLRELAKRMNLSEAAISYIENEKCVLTTDRLEDLARELGITVYMLLSGPVQQNELPQAENKLPQIY